MTNADVHHRSLDIGRNRDAIGTELAFDQRRSGRRPMTRWLETVPTYRPCVLYLMEQGNIAIRRPTLFGELPSLEKDQREP